MNTCVLVLSLFLFVGSSFAATQDDAFLGSQVECGQKAQELLNKGQDGEAVDLLGQGVNKFPESDWLRSLYEIGRASCRERVSSPV